MEVGKNIKVVDSFLLCEYILQRGGMMSHLKLQKILYYVQAMHLSYFDAYLIEDDFEAWLHGPVSRKVYDRVKGVSKLYGEIAFSEKEWGVNTPDKQLKKILTDEQLELINDTIDGYSKMTSSQLENLTHSEYPWINARKGYKVEDRCEVVIEKNIIAKFYKSQIYSGEQN